jgi:hypothetical protein
MNRPAVDGVLKFSPGPPALIRSGFTWTAPSFSVRLTARATGQHVNERRRPRRMSSLVTRTTTARCIACTDARSSRTTRDRPTGSSETRRLPTYRSNNGARDPRLRRSPIHRAETRRPRIMVWTAGTLIASSSFSAGGQLMEAVRRGMHERPAESIPRWTRRFARGALQDHASDRRRALHGRALVSACEHLSGRVSGLSSIM